MNIDILPSKGEARCNMRAWEYIAKTHLETIRDEAKRWYDYFGEVDYARLSSKDVMWVLEGIYDKTKKALAEIDKNCEVGNEQGDGCESPSGWRSSFLDAVTQPYNIHHGPAAQDCGSPSRVGAG